jgi:hypothetical protein
VKNLQEKIEATFICYIAVMQKRIILSLTLGTLLVLASCGNDRLTTQVAPQTVNQLTHNKPIKFTYHIEDTQIEEYGKGPGRFPLLGRLFKAIAKAMANASIGKEGVELNLPKSNVDLSSLVDVDFSTIDTITIDQLDVNISNAETKDNLSFIETVGILAKLKNPIDGLLVDENGYTRILYYERASSGLSCDNKCLVLKVEKIDWKKFFKENSSLEIKPVVTVNSVPDSTMKLAGLIEFSIKFNVGF